MRTSARALVVALAAAGCASAASTGQRSPSALPAARVSAASVDADMLRLMAAAKVAGLSLALIDHGQIVLERAYGVADGETRRPLTSTTIMYAASLTKAAFAHLVLQLVDEGVLSLDAKLPALLRRPLPEYPEFAALAGDDRWRQLTPRMLLSHTSGLVNWRWINDDKKLDFKFAPGTRFAYSGEGIQILQLVVEERTGEPLAPLMQRRVFDRFGMRDTSMVWRADFAGRTATGYEADGKPHPLDHRSHAQAAGSMDTTVHDYALFLAAVLRGEGLSPASARAMLSPQVAIVSPQEFPAQWPGETAVNRAVDLSYGLGWGLFRSPARPGLLQGGPRRRHQQRGARLLLDAERRRPPGQQRQRRADVLSGHRGALRDHLLALVLDGVHPLRPPGPWAAPGAREHPPAPRARCAASATPR